MPTRDCCTSLSQYPNFKLRVSAVVSANLTLNHSVPTSTCLRFCSVKGSNLSGDVPEGTFTFEDRTIAEDAIVKLRAAAAQRAGGAGPPFFLAVGKLKLGRQSVRLSALAAGMACVHNGVSK